MLPQYFIYISVLTSLYAGYFYIRDTLKGETKPNRVSWFIWFLVPMIVCLVQWDNGSKMAFLPIFMSGFIPLLVIIVSFWNPNAYWKLGKIDYICLALSLLAILSWLYFKTGVPATLFAILADGLAFIPTFIKSWRAPSTETAAPYYSGIFNGFVSAGTSSVSTFSAIGFAIYLIFANLAELAILWTRRKATPSI